MAKVFRPSNKEAKILSKIESGKSRARRLRINKTYECNATLCNAVSMKLIENKFVETNNKNGLEQELKKKIIWLQKAEDFDVDFKIAPFKDLIAGSHIVSLYLTACVIEDIINHSDTIDIFGSDDEIYNCINDQVIKLIP